jgi:hypothetical protein
MLGKTDKKKGDTMIRFWYTLKDLHPEKESFVFGHQIS